MKSWGVAFTYLIRLKQGRILGVILPRMFLNEAKNLKDMTWDFGAGLQGKSQLR